MFEKEIKLLIANGDISWREKIHKSFINHPRVKVIAMAGGGKDAISMARDTAPDAAIIDLGLFDMSGLDVAEQIAKVSPGTLVFIATDSPSMELWRRATALGVRQVFTKAMTAADIAGLIEQEVDRLREEAMRQAEKLPQVNPGSGPLRNLVKIQKELQTVRQVVIAVSSGIKGGVGKTTTSVNMACAAASQADLGVKVAIADLNEAGNVTIQLNMGTPEALAPRSILNWNYMPNNPSSEELEEFMLRHQSGAWVIPGVPSPERYPELTCEVIKKVVGILRSNFDLVVLDLPPSIADDAGWASIEMADYVFVITTPDDQELAGLKMFHKTVDQLGCASKCYRLVNKYNEPESISISDFYKLYSFPPHLGELPYDPLVRKGRKNGVPCVLMAPGSEYAVSLRRMLNKVFPIFSDATETPKKKVFGLFRRR